jgi:A nuclease family of the HNH/ENDO VII superfamily with conserved AHH
VIALNIFTGGAITAALPVIMQILTAVFLAQTIAQVGGYVSSFVSQSWAGNTAGGTKSMNNAIGVGVVELASYLTMKAGSVLAKGGKVAVNAAKSTFKAGVNLAKRGAQIVIKGAKWILEKGKLIFKGLDNAAGRAAKTLRGLGDDILQRVGFKGVKIKVHGRRFEIWGQINPWVLLATGDLKFVDDVVGEVGDKVKVGRQEGIVVGRNGKPGSGANPSEFVDDLANQTKKARKATFEELDGLDPDKLKGKIQGSGSKSTYELRKGIDDADQLPHFEAHHVAPEELLNDPKLKQFFDDIQFNPQDGARNGVMLPKQKFANADEYRKFLEDLKYDPSKIDNAVAKFDPNKWNNATPHNGSHPAYTQKMRVEAERLKDRMDDLVEQLETAGLTNADAVKQAQSQIGKEWTDFVNQTKGDLLSGKTPLN